MYSLGYAIRVIIRILSGERFRKATPAERKNYAFTLNLLALLVIFYPWFMFLIDKYSHTIIWLCVMGFLFPAVVITFWNSEFLPIVWSVLLSLCIISVPVIFALLSFLGTQLNYDRVASAVTLVCYLTIIVARRCIAPSMKNSSS